MYQLSAIIFPRWLSLHFSVDQAPQVEIILYFYYLGGKRKYFIISVLL